MRKRKGCCEEEEEAKLRGRGRNAEKEEGMLKKLSKLKVALSHDTKNGEENIME